MEKEGRSWLPELLLFTDDYVASGALAALAAHGIQAPRDVRFATLVNEGNRIPYAKRLSAFVYDPKKMALHLICPALAYLNRREIPVNSSQYMTYERGETFPWSSLLGRAALVNEDIGDILFLHGVFYLGYPYSIIQLIKTRDGCPDSKTTMTMENASGRCGAWRFWIVN